MVTTRKGQSGPTKEQLIEVLDRYLSREGLNKAVKEVGSTTALIDTFQVCRSWLTQACHFNTSTKGGAIVRPFEWEEQTLRPFRWEIQDRILRFADSHRVLPEPGYVYENSGNYLPGFVDVVWDHTTRWREDGL